MNKQAGIASAAFSATTFMTIFSYLYASAKNSNMKEPDLLAKMINRVTGLTKNNAAIAGWVLHYAVGLLFVEMYVQTWQRWQMRPSTKNGLLFGGISGVAAIVVWKLTLKKHPLPPAVNFKTHAVNLFIAHLVFGLFAGVTYKICVCNATAFEGPSVSAGKKEGHLIWHSFNNE